LYPYNTLAANIIGSFVIGLFTGAFEKKLMPTEPWKSLITTGYSGSLTTFSTYAMDCANYMMMNNT
jgi:CrcB protein